MIPLPTRSILFPYTTLFRSHHAVRIVAKGYVGVGQEVRRYALIQRRPARTGVGGLEDSADGDRDVQMPGIARSEEHTSELQSQSNLVCRLLLENKNKTIMKS